MIKNKFLALTLLILIVLALFTGCDSNSLSKGQYTVSRSTGLGDTYFYVKINDSDIIEKDVSYVKVKIRYQNYYGKSKTETFNVYMSSDGRGSFSINEVVTSFECKGVTAYFDTGESGENSSSVDSPPSIFVTIIMSLGIAIITFLIVFIPKCICCADSDGTLSLGAVGIIYIVYIIYAFSNWGFGHGLVTLICFIIYIALLIKMIDAIEDFIDSMRGY